MKAFITSILFLLLSVRAFAQPSSKTIAGTVADTKNEAIAGATVRLLNTKDSMPVKTEITNTNGRFVFSNMTNGSYVIAITAVGQKKFTGVAVTIDDEHNSIVLPVIVLIPQTSGLADVVVKARRPLIEQEIDKTVVNVEAMISSATSNTLEVLEKTPGVTVSSTGDISLNGRGGVLVLIDGRSTYLSGQDLAAYLKSLPGAILDKIELMDNPPARYDAAGNAIINIRLKKNRAGGFTGSVSTGYTQGRYARNNDAVNLNYNYKKINIFSNIGYNHEKNYTRDFYDRKFYNTAGSLTSSVLLLNNQQYTSTGTNVNIGIDYAATANTTYGVMVNLNGNRGNGLVDYSSTNYNAAHQPDTAGNGTTIGHDKRTNLGTNLNMVHKFGKTGRELSADINYLHYNGDGNQALQNFLYNPDGVLTGNNAFLYLLPSAVNIYTAKADYIHPFSNKAKFEAGVKSSIVDNDNLADYYTIKGTSQTIDNTQSNHFTYHENINAAYINGQKTWSRLGVQFGLRVENTQSTGRQLGNTVVAASSFTKSYTQLFPSLFITYKLDSAGSNTLAFSISRRINRPNYQLLNPFVFEKDKYSYTEGNPLLTPQYQYRYELRYTYKQFLRMGLSYNRFTNVIFQTTQTVSDVFITHPENVGTGFMLLLNTSATATPTKWWKLMTDVLLSRIGLNGISDGERLNPTTYVARINVLNQLQFNNGWNAELGGYYASTDLSGQTITSGMYRVNAGIQKKLWHDKGSIRLSVDDLFHSWVYHNRSVDLKQAQYLQVLETDTRRIGLAFTYRFGKDAFARKSKHENNASDEEKGRL